MTLRMVWRTGVWSKVRESCLEAKVGLADPVNFFQLLVILFQMVKGGCDSGIHKKADILFIPSCMLATPHPSGLQPQSKQTTQGLLLTWNIYGSFCGLCILTVTILE